MFLLSSSQHVAIENLTDRLFLNSIPTLKIDARVGQAESNSNKQVSYDTVVIDEAGRVSPLDLLIPLRQARRRIILVGDHRQLPQLLDQGVIDGVIADNSLSNKEDKDKTENAYKKTLFEYLFTQRLPTLTLNDGIQRCVTLDAQFRMHPLLGRFVSDHFYPSEEAFSSPRPESDFTHSLSFIQGNAAIWIRL